MRIQESHSGRREEPKDWHWNKTGAEISLSGSLAQTFDDPNEGTVLVPEIPANLPSGSQIKVWTPSGFFHGRVWYSEGDSTCTVEKIILAHPVRSEPSEAEAENEYFGRLQWRKVLTPKDFEHEVAAAGILKEKGFVDGVRVKRKTGAVYTMYWTERTAGEAPGFSEVPAVGLFIDGRIDLVYWSSDFLKQLTFWGQWSMVKE